MRGHVGRRGRTWSYVIDVGYDPITGRRRQQTKGGFPTRATAQSAMSSALAKGSGATQSRAGSMRLGEYLDQWLVTVEPRLRETTAASYRVAATRVKAALGGVRLKDLTPLAIEGFYGELARRGGRAGGILSPKTIRNTHIVLRKALSDAERLEVIDRNPAARAKAPSGVAPETPTWTAPDVARFLAGVRDDPLYALWVVLVTTGLRRGEALGLRWSDLDLARRTLSVAQTITTVSHRVIVSPPKSDRSRRQLVLDADTVRVLQEHRAAQDRDMALVDRKRHSADLVFSDASGKPLHPDSVTRRFQTLMRQVGAPPLRGPHDLRHTWASLALTAGVHPKVVSDRLGHSSISITIDTYSHVMPSLDADAAAIVAGQLFSSSPQRWRGATARDPGHLESS